MSGVTKSSPEGLQVIKVSKEKGRRYELDEEALGSVLLRNDVRNLPVMVVSVAGAYRGGKSFILDFFLRYLTASCKSQLNGDWLGKEDEKLEGFDWRGGCDSNTKGIHLWPEPIIVTIEGTGEKMAVLLMDTQGTFDTETDMGDNSTIFALSTLLSSVQIYNLRNNIHEDDLQHLQLFTEYGKLAHNGEGKIFQTLLFLIRDWINAYQYPYGYDGGELFMKKKLTPNPNQKKQIQEVREHIYSCFEDLQCFLLPHPGLSVSKEQFRGRLCDIEEQFKQSLLELVPALFDSKNLKPKTINGDQIRAQGLLEFFKLYVEIFNSEDLPAATTIFEATVEACMMLALREAYECYDSGMKANVREDQNVLEDMLRGWHSTALSSAVTHFEKKKKLGSQEYIATNLAQLQTELEGRLTLHLWQNVMKARDTLSEAKKAYNNTMTGVCTELSNLCLHPQDLRTLHLDAMQAALGVFQRARPLVPQELDAERKALLQELEQQYQSLCNMNKNNHWTAKLQSREIYLSRMNEVVDRRNTSFDALLQYHNDALQTAKAHFQSIRNRPTNHTEDTDQAQLQKELEVHFNRLQNENDYNNLTAKEAALNIYNNHVWSKWGPGSQCFHPRALEELHDEALTRAMTNYLKNREEIEKDEYKDELIQDLEERYIRLMRNNEFNNTQAVNQAYSEYTRHMDKHSQPGLSSVLVIPFLAKIFSVVPRQHNLAKEKALNNFKEKRVDKYCNVEEDVYLNILEQKINEAYEVYKCLKQGMIRELGFQQLFGRDTTDEYL